MKVAYWPGCVSRFNVSLDFRLLFARKILDASQQIAEPVVRIGADLIEGSGVLFEDVGEEGAHRMTEDNRVRHLHHGRFEMHGQQNIFLLRIGNLSGEEFPQRFAAHDRRVNDFPGLQSQQVLQDRDTAVLSDQLDSNGVGFSHHVRLFAAKEVTVTHRGNVSL